MSASGGRCRCGTVHAGLRHLRVSLVPVVAAGLVAFIPSEVQSEPSLSLCGLNLVGLNSIGSTCQGLHISALVLFALLNYHVQ